MNPTDQPTPTPETLVVQLTKQCRSFHGQLADMTRERDEAKKLNADLETELDIAREERDSLRKRWMESPECKSQNLARREIQARLEAESERDAAIADREKLREALEKLLNAPATDDEVPRQKWYETPDQFAERKQAWIANNSESEKARATAAALLSTLKP